MGPSVTKPFAEYSFVRLKTGMVDDKGRPVDANARGTIVIVHPTGPGQEPAYIVEVIRTSSDSSLVDARHGDLDSAEVPKSKGSWATWLLFGVACLCGLASVLSIGVGMEILKKRDGWAAIGYIFFFAPAIGLVSLLSFSIALVCFARRRRRIDLASVLLAGGTLAVTIVLVIILTTSEMGGC